MENKNLDTLVKSEVSRWLPFLQVYLGELRFVEKGKVQLPELSSYLFPYTTLPLVLTPISTIKRKSRLYYYHKTNIVSTIKLSIFVQIMDNTRTKMNNDDFT